MIKTQTSKQLRIKRLPRIRKFLAGSSSRPRLTVFKSHKALSVQAVDDSKKKVMFSVRIDGKTIASGAALGKTLAVAAQKHGVKKALFDRSGYRYHGAVKAIAEAARQGGLHI